MKLKHLIIGFGIALIFFATILVAGEDSRLNRTRSTKETPVPSLTFSQWKVQAEEISHATLLRYGEQHKGKLVYFRGRVGFVNEFSSASEIKVRVRQGGFPNWDTDSEVLLRYGNPAVRVLEADIVTFIGEMEGVWAFDQIPEITLIALEVE